MLFVTRMYVKHIRAQFLLWSNGTGGIISKFLKVARSKFRFFFGNFKEFCFNSSGSSKRQHRKNKQVSHQKIMNETNILHFLLSILE